MTKIIPGTACHAYDEGRLSATAHGPYGDHD